jgi:hypothetical protein
MRLSGMSMRSAPARAMSIKSSELAPMNGLRGRDYYNY